MTNLTEHVMINKWDDDINAAITQVGGDCSDSSGLPDYADIIKKQLVAKNGSGEYQTLDYLYDTPNGDKSIYPWEGTPTDSELAPKSSIIAHALQELFLCMANTERFKVLLVDNFPTNEIDISSIYLVKNESSCDCGCDCCDDSYIGCYYVKAGKNIIRVDLPEFTIKLDDLFYLTRAEYKNDLSNNVAEVEKIISKKFGSYWDDETFTLDKAIEDIRADLVNTIGEEIDAKLQNHLKKSDLNYITSDELNKLI